MGMNPFYKNLALWMVIGLVVVLLFNVFGGLSEKTTFEPNYSDFLKNVDAGLVQAVTIRGNLVTGKLKDGGESARTSSNRRTSSSCSGTRTSRSACARWTRIPGTCRS